jgi:hypothetical protein
MIENQRLGPLIVGTKEYQFDLPAGVHSQGLDSMQLRRRKFPPYRGDGNENEEPEKARLLH